MNMKYQKRGEFERTRVENDCRVIWWFFTMEEKALIAPCIEAIRANVLVPFIV